MDMFPPNNGNNKEDTLELVIKALICYQNVFFGLIKAIIWTVFVNFFMTPLK